MSQLTILLGGDPAWDNAGAVAQAVLNAWIAHDRPADTRVWSTPEFDPLASRVVNAEQFEYRVMDWWDAWISAPKLNHPLADPRAQSPFEVLLFYGARWNSAAIAATAHPVTVYRQETFNRPRHRA